MGDVLDVDDAAGTVRTAGDLTGRGVGFECGPQTPPGTFIYDSDGSVTVRFKVAGQSPAGFAGLAQADAGAMISFDRASSVFVVFSEVTQTGMADTRSVAADIVRRYWAGSWDDRLAAVTDVVSAASATVLAASKGGASAELRAAASVGAGPLALADLAGGVTVATSKSVGLQWTGSAVTPFHRVVRLSRNWMNRIEVRYGAKQPGRGASPVPVPAIVVEEAHDDPGSVLEQVQADAQLPFNDEPTPRKGA
ncbi:hypothetical protein [Pseudonocardia broussonetiae]|uniref:Uncharacterized protein n=1 Tax=Pseudonocardia broussonetiae TaxID=2736640 RepID=A0A6M6JKQ8_9PSEU|nr:hypothetical protein [Pseudonocardia broussonetiae]QJY47946.1 hypothetical protein HOP40_20870 [Pseudonocardia broussonetiae]